MGSVRKGKVDPFQLTLNLESETMEKGVIVVKELNDGMWLIEILRLSPSGQRYSSSLYVSREEALEIQSKLPNDSA